MGAQSPAAPTAGEEASARRGTGGGGGLDSLGIRRVRGSDDALAAVRSGSAVLSLAAAVLRFSGRRALSFDLSFCGPPSCDAIQRPQMTIWWRALVVCAWVVACAWWRTGSRQDFTTRRCDNHISCSPLAWSSRSHPLPRPRAALPRAVIFELAADSVCPFGSLPSFG